LWKAFKWRLIDFVLRWRDFHGWGCPVPVQSETHENRLINTVGRCIRTEMEKGVKDYRSWSWI
jgi:hypothetical protein